MRKLCCQQRSLSVVQKKKAIYQLLSLLLFSCYGCGTIPASVPTVDAAALSTSVVETVFAEFNGSTTPNALGTTIQELPAQTPTSMITAFPASTFPPTFTSTPVPSPVIIFEDNFDTKSGLWYEGELRDYFNTGIEARTEYRDGHYVFVAGDNRGNLDPYMLSNFSVADGVFSIDAIITEDEKNSGIFFAWRVKPVENFLWTGYRMHITPSQRTFSIDKVIVVARETGNNYEGKTTTYDREVVTLSNTFKDLSLYGLGRSNHFDFAFHGNTMKLFINNQLILAITDGEYNEGAIGFGTNSILPTTVEFDNLRIYDYDTWMRPYESLTPIYDE